MNPNIWKKELEQFSLDLNQFAARLHGEHEMEVAALRARENELRRQLKTTLTSGLPITNEVLSRVKNVVTSLKTDLALLEQKFSSKERD